MKKRVNKGNIFQIWNSFIIFILIPVVLLNIAIIYLLFDMKQTTKEIVEAKLIQAQFLLDKNINDSLMEVEKIGSNYSIQKLAHLQEPLEVKDYNVLFDAKKYRQDGFSTNEAYEVHILFNRSNIFLSGQDVCMDLKYFYSISYQFGDLAFEDIKESGYKGREITFYPDMDFVIGAKTKRGIMYTTVLTQYAGENSGATAIVLFQEETLMSILEEIELWDGLIYIMDANGQILYQTGNEMLNPVSFPYSYQNADIYKVSEDIFGKGNFAMAGNLKAGLQIVSVSPEKSLYMRMGTLYIFIWILNITTIVMCLILSFNLAKKRSSVLSGLLEMMSHERGEKENIFSALQLSVSHLVDDNVSLQNALSEQKKLLQSVFWNRVLSVSTMSDEEIVRLANSADIHLHAKAYCLLLIGFGHENEMKAENWNALLEKREEIMEKFYAKGTSKFYITSQGIDQLVILVPLPKERIKYYQDYVTEELMILKEMMQQETQVFCVGSTSFDTLKEIYNAYSVCRNQLNLCTNYIQNREIIWCSEDGLDTENTFSYSDELKSQIVLWIKAGQKDLVREGFQRILDENYLDHKISSVMEQLLVSKLKLTLFSAYDRKMDIKLTEVFENIDEIQTDAWIFSYIWRIALKMCDFYIEHIKNQESGMQKKIVNYIEEHFSEYSFSLSSVASHCNLSESYFSQIFKEIIGENFSSYVEKKRMNYAYDLIVETSMTIDTVAENTGYSNTNAFRKAYKRFYGLSPSQSRKIKEESLK